MQTRRYTLNQYSIEILLNWIKSGEIAIPEIQRPFVWSSNKVRDFIDSRVVAEADLDGAYILTAEDLKKPDRFKFFEQFIIDL